MKLLICSPLVTLVYIWN